MRCFPFVQEGGHILLPDFLILIGASHGGPQALATLLRFFPADFAYPVVLVQHIGEGRSEDFATWLEAKIHLLVKEAEDGEVLEGGFVFVAPGGHNLRVGIDACIHLKKDDAVNNCRPSVDVLFGSGAENLKERCIAVLLSGMGEDGAIGAGAIQSAGGTTLVQDEASSAVFGMPGRAIALGFADVVGPPQVLAEALLKLVGCCVS